MKYSNLFNFPPWKVTTWGTDGGYVLHLTKEKESKPISSIEELHTSKRLLCIDNNPSLHLSCFVPELVSICHNSPLGRSLHFVRWIPPVPSRSQSSEWFLIPVGTRCAARCLPIEALLLLKPLPPLMETRYCEHNGLGMATRKHTVYTHCYFKLSASKPQDRIQIHNFLSTQ